MTDNECKRILEYLDKNELEELRKYILKEKENEYLSNARKALNKYLNARHLVFSQEHGQLIISDTYSIIILNSSDVLTKNTKYKLQIRTEYKSKKLKKFIKGTYEKVKNITSEGEISLVHLENKKSISFLKERIELFKSILGSDDIEYSYSIDSSTLQIKTKKGEGYILGYKDK